MIISTLVRTTLILLLLALGPVRATAAHQKTVRLSRAEYLDRVQGAWNAQIIACMMGFQFEHKVASVEWVNHFPGKVDSAIVDDDWYYEMCAVRAFEKHGIDLSVAQLGEQWKENNCGSWGSSEQARLILAKGIKAPDCGHPRYNKYWFSIGPQFSAELYGLLAPAQPNLAAKLARELSHINGYAEASDGAVFMAGMVSLAFAETDTHVIVKKAATLIHPDSPYRQMLDLLIAMAEAGKSAQEIADAIEDRWHIEYPWTNNAMPNGGIAALGVWFGQGDFLRTVNIIYRAADYTDADCNAANAAAVVGAMHGMKCLPQHLVSSLHDRIAGATMGKVELTPPVDETISGLARRTVLLGERFILGNKGNISGDKLTIPLRPIITPAAELFSLSDLTQFWNPDWKLERAGFGGSTGGISDTRGITYLDGDVLATWPRDRVRGVVLRREVRLSEKPSLSFSAGVDSGRAWDLEIYAGNKRLYKKLIDGSTSIGTERKWYDINIDLGSFAQKEVQLRLYQRILTKDKIPGNAYWKSLRIQ